MTNMLAQFAMNQLGFGPVGEIRMVAASGAPYNYFRGKIEASNFHAGTGMIWKAEAATVTGRNDVILVTPESHAWRGDDGAISTALTWDKSNTHMLGLSPTSLAGYNRARFSHSGQTMANFMTVSGDDNCFKNIRWMHGAAEPDHTCITVSGVGNRFENCAFAGPNSGLQAAAADYKGVIVSGSHNYFKGCMFGSVNDIDRSAANSVLYLAATCGAWNVFENCVFRSRSGGGQTTAVFIDDAVTDTVDDYTAIFLNCQFIHKGGTLALGISKVNNSRRFLYFDNRCSFAGVSDVVTDAYEQHVMWGSAGANGDTTAIGDRLALGLARAPVNTT